MQRLLFTFIMAFALISCGQIRHDFTNEEYSIPQDSMIVKCAELKGLGPLVIDKTRYDDINTSKFDYAFDSKGFSTVLGKWRARSEAACEMLNNDSDCKVFRLDKFKVGEIEFSTVELAFYNDELVAIAFSNGSLLSHYISKYGTGDGHKHVNNYIYKDSKKDRYDHSEEHLWYNNFVQMEYQDKFRNERHYIPVFNEYTISDRTGKYANFLNEIEKVNEECSKAKKQAEQNSLDML